MIKVHVTLHRRKYTQLIRGGFVGLNSNLGGGCRRKKRVKKINNEL